MFTTTRGIVFHQTKYSDTSLVVKIFTEETGLGSYIIKGARGPKARIKASLFQPLTLLELVVSLKEKTDLQHIREARLAHPYQNIHSDIRKSSILLFLNELLYKAIQEETANPELFKFIYEHLIFLDETAENCANFHLSFALHLTRYLGFFPQGEYRGDATVFDLAEGHFSQVEPLPADGFITGSHCNWFNRLLTTVPTACFALPLPGPLRQDLLEQILRYYRHHLPITGEFKSHIILHEVLQK